MIYHYRPRFLPTNHWPSAKVIETHRYFDRTSPALLGAGAHLGDLGDLGHRSTFGISISSSEA